MLNGKKLAAEIEQEVIAWRRGLHQRAELSFQEKETTEYLAAVLTEIGVPFRRTEPTGLIGEIKGGKPGKTVALRADIDALPICEPEGLPFRSAHEGVMHACGHDTHAAMLLGAAKILWENREALSGTVRLIFQPGEETGKGAETMIEQGAMDGVAAVFGIHAVPMEPAGRMSVAAGPIQASNDEFSITVTGRACHGAAPEDGADATVAAAAVVLALQTIVSRETAPLEPLCVTVGQFQSGVRFNIVSGKAELNGTVRCFSEQTRAAVPGLLERIAKSTAAVYGCTAKVQVGFDCGVLSCDERLTAIARKAAAAASPDGMTVAELPKKMVSEDFASYTGYAPGSFVTVGIGGDAPLHNERMTVDESALKTGVAMHVEMAQRLLEEA